jgi:hypothetical protein
MEVYNLTRGEWSVNQYTISAQPSEILETEPTWNISDTLVGGGESGYTLINGDKSKVIKNIYDGAPVVIGFEVHSPDK